MTAHFLVIFITNSCFWLVNILSWKFDTLLIEEMKMIKSIFFEQNNENIGRKVYVNIK